MIQSNSRRLALSIAIVSLMLTTSMLTQTSTATALTTMQKSLALTAGADGRAFALINGTYQYPSTQRVDYNSSFDLYAINHLNGRVSYQYPGVGPKFETPQSGFDPYSYPTGFLGSHFEVPKFMMMRNTSLNVVSPTINITARAVTIGSSGTTEFPVDTSNYVIATLTVSSGDQGKLMALTGLLTGSDVHFDLYNPNNAPYTPYAPWSLEAGYFAFPFLASLAGKYAFYFASDGASTLQVTAKVLDVTSLSMGSYATGEIKMPTDIGPEVAYVLDPEPSQIKAVSCDVSAGDEFIASFSTLEHLRGTLAPSQVTCWYFDQLEDEYGIPMGGPIAYPGVSAQSVTSMAVTGGKVYIVLVANVPSRINYQMGFTTTAIPTAPLNAAFNVTLPVAGLTPTQLFKFELTSDSMVRFNRTAVADDTMSATLSRITSEGTVYYSYLADIEDTSTNCWIRQGNVEAAYSYAKYMPAGTYLMGFDSSGLAGRSSALIQVNAYPIENYTLGASLDVTGRTTRALDVSISEDVLQYYAFNVSLISPELNASILYQLSLFDDYGRYLGSIIKDGVSSRYGLGNRMNTGVSANNYYVDPETPSTQRLFSGNKTDRECLFVPTYAGNYFLVLDCLNCYNTTTTGLGGTANRWRFYTGAVTLEIDLSEPDYADIGGGVNEIVYTALNSSLGTGSTTLTLTSIVGASLQMVGLKLTPKANTWTRISVTIINGTSGGTINGSRTPASRYERVFDRIRYGPVGSSETRTFNYDNSITPKLWSDEMFYGVSPAISGRQNTTYIIEFGAFQHEMLIRFLVELYDSGTAAHTVVSFSVEHYNTTAFSGLAQAPAPSAAGVFPLEIVLVVGVVVAAALVVIFIVVKKRSGGPH